MRFLAFHLDRPCDTRTRRVRWRAAAVALLILAVPPVEVRAGEIHRDGTVLRWSAAPGEANVVRTGAGDTDMLLIDDVGVTAGAGCTQNSATVATCGTVGVSSFVLEAGDLADRLDVNQMQIPTTARGGAEGDTMGGAYNSDLTLEGQAGDDVIGGWGASQSLIGGDGNDWLAGDSGADRLQGGPGDDLLEPGGGEAFDAGDVVSGGGGIDKLNYFGVNGDRRITFDGLADDGTVGEHDNVAADIEIYVGGNGADDVIASDVDNDLKGGAGADVLDGGGGADILRASGDDDVLKGGAGDDRFDEGAPEGHYIQGYNGSNVLVGGAGTDTADYGVRSAALSIDADGVADDGDPVPKRMGIDEVVERDNVGADIERVVGGSGADSLQALRVEGNAGDDVLLDVAGAQTLDGGPGIDEVSYAARAQSIAADADGQAGDDGAAGEGDTVATSVESLRGGSGADQLRGNDAAGVLAGGHGADLLDGRGGDDSLEGGPGTDVLEAAMAATPPRTPSGRLRSRRTSTAPRTTARAGRATTSVPLATSSASWAAPATTCSSATRPPTA